MTTPTPPGPVVFGHAVLDTRRRELIWDGTPRHLRPKAFDVLVHLAANAGRVVGKQELIDEVWSGAAVTDDSLVQCLVDIRRSLGGEQDVIKTVRGRGYLLDAEVRPADAGTDPYGEFVSRPGATEGPPVSAPSAPAVARWRWAPWMALAAGLVAVAVVWAMRPSVEPAAATEPGTTGASVMPQVTLNSAVVRLMVEGNTAVQKRSQVALLQARSAFEQAVRLDGRYAPAHAALANSLVMLSVFGVERPLSVLPAASEHARQTVTLDSTYSFGWTALAHTEVHWNRDWAAAEAHYRRALALDPKSEVPAFLLAHLLIGVGRTSEALEQSRNALAINPTSPVLLSSTGLIHYFAGRSSDAVPFFEQALEADPTYSTAAFWQALTLANLGRLDEAMAAALRARTEMGNTPTWLVGYLHAKSGRIAEARAVLQAIEAQAASQYVPANELAYLFLALDDKDTAIRWLERAVEEHSRWIELMAVDPLLDPLRDTPRFRALLRTMRLETAP